jgi:hypothetical protein
MSPLSSAETDPDQAPGAWREWERVPGSPVSSRVPRDDRGADSRSAAAQPDGTAHPDPFLADRGWATERGVYVRNPPGRDAEREAG